MDSLLTPAPFFNRATPQGDGLVEILRHLTPLASRGGADTWLIVDQNGEEYRANDWGHALVRVRDNQPAYENPVLWYPAISYGDTGSASGAVALSMALNAHERGYAPSPNALVLSSADGTERGGCVLSQPGG